MKGRSEAHYRQPGALIPAVFLVDLRPGIRLQMSTIHAHVYLRKIYITSHGFQQCVMPFDSVKLLLVSSSVAVAIVHHWQKGCVQRILCLNWLVLQSPPLAVDRVYVVVEMINALVPLLRIEQARLGLQLRVSFVFVDQARSASQLPVSEEVVNARRPER
jgi:hypothetical protein